MTKPTCIVTGATGLIGSALIPTLVQRYQVHGVSRRPQTTADVTWHTRDLATGCDLGGFPRQVDAVVYLAQSELFRDFPAHSLEVHQVNTGNLLRFLDYAQQSGAKHFVYASSGGVYGTEACRMSEGGELVVRDDLSFYLATKLSSEVISRSFSALLNVVILRFFFVYGPGQHQSMLIPRLIKRVREGEPIHLDGEHGIRINPTHVSDAVASTMRALELHGSHTINVCGPDILTMREIGQTIGRQVKRDPVFRIDLCVAPKHLSGDISKMCELLVPPRMRFSDGVRSML